MQGLVAVHKSIATAPVDSIYKDSIRAGCGGSKTLLSAKDPTMLSIWHVYGEQADSPMNRLLTEFNDTVGKEKGILLNVTNMSNSAAIGSQLQDAKAGKPGALDLPDLFSDAPR